jgi:hypothetical protein
MDNRVFNVNGRTKEQLKLAINLLLLNEYNKVNTVAGWYYKKEKGLVLTSYNNDKTIPFTDRMGKATEIGVDELIDVLWDWLQSDEAKAVECVHWDADFHHDGSNVLGWRLYTEDWGHIRETEHTIDHSTIAAFKPAYLWYGK